MDIIEVLETRGREISLAVIDEMYKRDSFWNDRFGARGRVHADEDAGRHIEHLLTALRANSTTLFVEYGRWLRAVLTTRGMCTHHLAVNFELLADTLAKIDDGVRAAAILREAADALYVVEGPAAELFVRAREQRDNELLMYLADAVLNDEPKHFAAHVAFRRTDASSLAKLRAAVAGQTRALHILDAAPS